MRQGCKLELPSDWPAPEREEAEKGFEDFLVLQVAANEEQLQQLPRGIEQRLLKKEMKREGNSGNKWRKREKTHGFHGFFKAFRGFSSVFSHCFSLGMG